MSIMTAEEMDTKIMSRLRLSIASFTDLRVAMDMYGSLSNNRQIDLRLQALRRARKIQFLKKFEGGPGWVIR